MLVMINVSWRARKLILMDEIIQFFCAGGGGGGGGGELIARSFFGNINGDNGC